MGIRFACPNGHKLNVKEHLAGKRGICPQCGEKFVIPEAPVDWSAATPSQVDLPSVILAPASAEPPAESLPVVRPPAPEEADQAPPTPVALPLEIQVNESPPIQPEVPREVVPVAQYMAHRNRSRRTQRAVAIALFGMVVVLAIVLIWVLNRDTKGVESSSGATGQMTHRESAENNARNLIAKRKTAT